LNKLSYHINEESSLLLLGESGVGKSYLAKHIIHDLSDRAKDGFAFLNCSSLPTELINGTIFGFEKGAFTGAHKEKKSLFEQAEHGTVFLDEIGFAEKRTQLALLTFLDEKKYTKVGGEEMLTANCRILFGTDQDLERLVHEGHFLKQLYERISNDVRITIPPIRDRKQDIETIITKEIEKLNKEKEEEPVIEIEQSAVEHLQSYPWPGNYRQLVNNLQRWFIESKHTGKFVISKKQINEDPPRTTFFTEGKLVLLEKMFEDYLRTWDKDLDGKFRDDFVNPVLAKVFIENVGDIYSKSHSNKVLGLDAGGKLFECYDVYNEKIRGKKST